MKLSRLLMGMFYICAGILHFVATHAYESIVPDYLPAHHQLVLISGVAEIAGGLGILIAATQVPAAYGIIVLLLAVMPANVWMAQHPERYGGVPPWVLYVRLPLQVLLIIWAWRFTLPRHDREER